MGDLHPLYFRLLSSTESQSHVFLYTQKIDGFGERSGCVHVEPKKNALGRSQVCAEDGAKEKFMERPKDVKGSSSEEHAANFTTVTQQDFLCMTGIF